LFLSRTVVFFVVQIFAAYKVCGREAYGWQGKAEKRRAG